MGDYHAAYVICFRISKSHRCRRGCSPSRPRRDWAATLQRATRRLEERVPGRTQQATLRALEDRELRRIVSRFADAWERNDVAAVVAMLADDAR